MNKSLQLLLTILALAGMYCAIPKNNAPSLLVTGVQRQVLVADGSDPMPLCRRGHCK